MDSLGIFVIFTLQDVKWFFNDTLFYIAGKIKHWKLMDYLYNMTLMDETDLKCKSMKLFCPVSKSNSWQKEFYMITMYLLYIEFISEYSQY